MNRLPIVLVLLALTGCGKESKDGGPKKEQTAKENRELTVAAASDLQFVFDEIAAAFEKKHPNIKIKLVYGSSGNFFAQISNKAPFDVFLSADVDYPKKLVEEGHAVKGSEFSYAIGHIVVWVRKDSAIDVEKLGMEALLHASVKKIAIANPKHAPYGRAAEAALKKLGLYEKVQERLVMGENIAQAAQYAESGAADIGIIAQSLATAPTLKDKGRFFLVPSDAYPPLEQAGVILSASKDREAAEQLRGFLTGPEGREVLKRYGFGLPGG